ncbi:coenzyme F420-0:L-glutamate ligase [Thermogemmatispora tikiterensis]|uniref:Coenzyme F420-0:L-glutamate ligase n=1 Tax=Thermogemmatispora tikiterensis TaxID=1825093 RepID=A0A328VFJ7_9CHLR|nr:coenzyme F420-0:L-glutamate ligase [Thermogemmatispora tikiterensis]RAQ94530.1 coenzyme F420-0:L-glutamate ligase [Thermogemmatispora tikiterensis]
MGAELRIIPVTGIGDITPGSDLGVLISAALQAQGVTLANGDILVVTQKIVSKAEGRLVRLEEVTPSAFALTIARETGKDPRHVEVILQETRRLVRMDRGVLICETHHGFVCANAGVDESNLADQHQVSLLPRDPDHSARTLRERLLSLAASAASHRSSEGEPLEELAVIISDTWGRPWRNGQVNMAIGVAGLEPIRDYRGEPDAYGRELRVSAIAVADELAAAAELVMGKSAGVPVALIRGYPYIPTEGGVGPLLRDAASDLFR